jgi:hypothetical protein
MKLLATIRSVQQFINQTINIFNELSIKMRTLPALNRSMVSSGIKLYRRLFNIDAQC